MSIASVMEHINVLELGGIEELMNESSQIVKLMKSKQKSGNEEFDASKIEILMLHQCDIW